VTAVPHAQLRADQDRSWTSRLLAWLPTATEQEQLQILHSLEQLADPRSFAPLTQLLETRRVDPTLREQCARVLRNLPVTYANSDIARWWASGDAVLERHALYCMDLRHADIVGAIALAPEHPYHQASLETMLFGFEAPRFQAMKIEALGHPSAVIRHAAARTLFMDEPLAAQRLLMQCLADSAPEVAEEAALTLEYYPSMVVLRALAQRAQGANTQRSLACIRDQFEHAVRDARSAAARTWLVRWMQPVADLVDLAAKAEPSSPPNISHESATDPVRAPEPIAACLDLDEWIAHYREADAPWAARFTALRGLTAQSIAVADVPHLIAFLSRHPDPSVRECSCRLLAELGAKAELLHLMRDPVFVVRKSAVYALGLLPSDPTLAPVLSRHLKQTATTSTHAYETLVAYARHATVPIVLRWRLVHLVQDDHREAVRYHAVCLLAAAGATRELQGLAPLLAEAPRVTWSVHLALLSAYAKLDIAADVGRLRAVDNLDVQVALAEYAAARTA
jgi:HEAT repeat protein